MSRSKRTQKQIQQDKRTKRFEHVGDPEVAEKLQEIEFMPSSLETIDKAMLRFIDEDLNLFTTTNDGFKKTPVLWVTADRSIKRKQQSFRTPCPKESMVPIRTLLAKCSIQTKEICQLLRRCMKQSLFRSLPGSR
jgi:hypothetical protein